MSLVRDKQKMLKFKKLNFAMIKNQGQALVLILFFMTITVTIVSAAVATMIINSASGNSFYMGNQAKTVAESGAENALIRLLRNPQYSGETLSIGSGETVITVTGDSTKTIISEGRDGNNIKKIEVIAQFENFMLNILSWREI